MLRVPTDPRPDWPRIVESQGLTFHSIDGQPYWDESAYYLFEAGEIDSIEQATSQLDAMCLQAVEHVISRKRLGEFDIPEPFHRFVEESWERDEQSIYGRFDLVFDGTGPPRLLEYNADTPTSLLESSVIQWFWSRDLLEPLGDLERANFDQFNSTHERLIEAWGRIGRELGPRVTFGAIESSVEDVMTITYLRDVATQAGLATQPIDVEGIGWDDRRRVFTDLRERPIEILFKLYPWEWMLREPFGRNLPNAPTRWLEPPWKMILSNKAILVVLSELFPESPYLLHADFAPKGPTHVSKPFYSREGANVSIVEEGVTIAETGGDYGEGRRIYQEFRELPDFGGVFPVIGSWMVNGNACGLGIREDDGPITRNSSRFLPHIFRKSPHLKPPTMQSRKSSRSTIAGSTGRDDPLWDPWIDR
ncbi:glutathionylspermidine synthase family protein [Tundrisphaera lichenicola]|uniref:glutathionylspermidine synthase family protein n=1 Tax=Tundrisphaera lichenicola TaxID=2029860 RepID=UPI003EBE615D